MKRKKINNSTYLIRLEKGEEIMSTLLDFCQKENIKGGYLKGIGALSEVELALYDLDKKKYHNKKIEEALEIINLFATITATKIHAHITLSNKDMKALGGHLNSGIISATCEIILHKFEENINRYKDKEVGLELMDL